MHIIVKLKPLNILSSIDIESLLTETSMSIDSKMPNSLSFRVLPLNISGIILAGKRSLIQSVHEVCEISISRIEVKNSMGLLQGSRLMVWTTKTPIRGNHCTGYP